MDWLHKHINNIDIWADRSFVYIRNRKRSIIGFVIEGPKYECAFCRTQEPLLSEFRNHILKHHPKVYSESITTTKRNRRM